MLWKWNLRPRPVERPSAWLPPETECATCGASDADLYATEDECWGCFVKRCDVARNAEFRQAISGAE